MKVYLIVAMDRQYGIGNQGTLPWHFPTDMRFFAGTTRATTDPQKRNVLIMGRKTFDSLKAPLKGRRHIVISRCCQSYIEGVLWVSCLEDALELADSGDVETVFIIGGGEIFAQAIDLDDVAGMYVTHIDAEYACDTFFPRWTRAAEKSVIKEVVEKKIKLTFCFYQFSKSNKVAGDRQQNSCVNTMARIYGYCAVPMT